MVARDTNTPDDPSRSLSPAVERELERAARLVAADAPDAADAVRAAVESLGRDARSRELRPEELLLAFKTLETRLGMNTASRWSEEHSRLRARLIHAMLVAYYA